MDACTYTEKIFLTTMSRLPASGLYKKSNFLFLLCFKIAIIKVYSTAAIGTETQLFFQPFLKKSAQEKMPTGE